jgi:hypothetical protein
VEKCKELAKFVRRVLKLFDLEDADFKLVLSDQAQPEGCLDIVVNGEIIDLIPADTVRKYL